MISLKVLQNMKMALEEVVVIKFSNENHCVHVRPDATKVAQIAILCDITLRFHIKSEFFLNIVRKKVPTC